jgi:hypothetical protein
MVYLKNMQGLIRLDLEGTGITDAGLESLKGNKNLKVLFIGGCKVSPLGVEMLEQKIPDLDMEGGPR